MTFFRITAATTLIATLAACGGDTTVRTGPQAVHPSNSFLANGVFIAVDGDQGTAPATSCSDLSQSCAATNTPHHAQSRYDGSTPIID